MGKPWVPSFCGLPRLEALGLALFKPAPSGETPGSGFLVSNHFSWFPMVTGTGPLGFGKTKSTIRLFKGKRLPGVSFQPFKKDCS